MPSRTRQSCRNAQSSNVAENDHAQASRSPSPGPAPPTKTRNLAFTVDLSTRLIAATRAKKPFAAPHGATEQSWQEVADLVSKEAGLEIPLARKSAKDKIKQMVDLHRVRIPHATSLHSFSSLSFLTEWPTASQKAQNVGVRIHQLRVNSRCSMQ